MSISIFMYGTLKTGGSLTNKLLDKKRIRADKAVLSGALLYDLDSFPGVVLTGSEENKVYGEIHEYEDGTKIIDMMDQIEGYDERQPEKSLFLRRKISVFNVDTNEYEEVYFYEFNEERVFPNKNMSKFVTLIESGEW